MTKPRVRVYTDHKSPYAYVANKPLFDLEEAYDVELEWLPYTLRVAEFMGTVEERTPHFWRKVRYAYMDARRYANASVGPCEVQRGSFSWGMTFSTTKVLTLCARSVTSEGSAKFRSYSVI